MSDRDAIRRLRPGTRRNRQQLQKIASLAAFVVVTVSTWLIVKHHVQTDRELNWSSATATIEDVRTVPVVQANSQAGSAMFYEVQILARYSVDHSAHEQWITVQQIPKHLADAQLQGFRWKGKTCIVRWKPGDPGHPVAEVS